MFEEREKFLIAGIGAIGTIYAAKLKDAGYCVKVLVDKERFDRYSKEGRFFNGKRYDFDYILPEDKSFNPKYILIAVKSYDLDIVIKNLKNFVREKTVILSLLNGISSEREIRMSYPLSRVLDSYYVGHASMRETNKISYDGVGKIVFSGMEELEGIFTKAQIKYEVPADMESSKWQKFIINIGVNQTTAVLRKSYSCFREENAREIARGLMLEGVEIAKSLNISGTEQFIENTFKLIDNMPPECKTSMMQDIEKGFQTEVEIFSGEICRLGKEKGIDTSRNEIVYRIIKNMENRLD